MVLLAASGQVVDVACNMIGYCTRRGTAHRILVFHMPCRFMKCPGKRQASLRCERGRGRGGRQVSILMAELTACLLACHKGYDVSGVHCILCASCRLFFCLPPCFCSCCLWHSNDFLLLSLKWPIVQLATYCTHSLPT